MDIPIQLTCAICANASLDLEGAMLISINILHSMHLDFLFVRTSNLASSLTTSVELI